jgi:hypothetical protein
MSPGRKSFYVIGTEGAFQGRPGRGFRNDIESVDRSNGAMEIWHLQRAFSADHFYAHS